MRPTFYPEVYKLPEALKKGTMHSYPLRRRQLSYYQFCLISLPTFRHAGALSLILSSKYYKMILFGGNKG